MLTTKRHDFVIGATTEVASLKKALSEAENKATMERIEREKQNARVGEVQQELQELGKKFESLEHDFKMKECELAKALLSLKDAKAEAEKAQQEIQAAKKIAAGKTSFMQSKHVEETFLSLTRIRSSPGAFVDLPCSISDVVEFYRAEEGSSTEKLFWSQYVGAEHPMPLSDQLKQLVELHRAAEVAMKDFIVWMWSGEPLPASYFCLIKRMVNACPRLEVIKRSVCIVGARRAFARAKVHWGKLDVEKLVKDGPPEGKAHRCPEKYYDGVMKGAHLVADECTKDTIFE